MYITRNRRKPWRSKKCGFLSAEEAKKMVNPTSPTQEGIIRGHVRIIRGWRPCKELALTEIDGEREMTRQCAHECISCGHELGVGSYGSVRYTCPLRKGRKGDWGYSVYFPVKCRDQYVWRPNKEHVVRTSKKKPVLPPVAEEDSGLQRDGNGEDPNSNRQDSTPNCQGGDKACVDCVSELCYPNMAIGSGPSLQTLIDRTHRTVV